MAPRTLASAWKSFERLARRYEEAKPPRFDQARALDDLSSKTNSSRIVAALGELFVQGHHGMEEVGVEFYTSGGGEFPDWTTNYLPEENKLLVNPVGVFRFRKQCEESAAALRTLQARKDFRTYRYRAYLSELCKLPARYMLFLQVLSGIGEACEVTHVEKKKGGGFEDVEDENYMNLLWAFNELEAFVSEHKGINIRSEYSIRWYESDWVVMKKKR